MKWQDAVHGLTDGILLRLLVVYVLWGQWYAITAIILGFAVVNLLQARSIALRRVAAQEKMNELAESVQSVKQFRGTRAASRK